METMELSSVDQEAITRILASFGIGFGVACLVIIVLAIVAMWKVFKKAGQAGWKSLIPIYNEYILFKIADHNFWPWFIAIIVGNICNTMAASFEGNTAVALILSIVGFVCGIYGLVEAIRMTHGLSKNFGHDAGFTVGLIFLNLIFMLILAFGGSQYKGGRQEQQ